MLRRLPTTRIVALSLRHSGSSPTFHDHSDAFSRPLTVPEQLSLEDQKLRTVSGVVPGKLFMRHWVAGEQATISIVNRAVSVFTSFGILLWAVGFSGFGLSSMTAIHAMLGVYLLMWFVMHTHFLWLIPVFLSLVTAQIALN
jgi:hypothetical protein